MSGISYSSARVPRLHPRHTPLPHRLRNEVTYIDLDRNDINPCIHNLLDTYIHDFAQFEHDLRKVEKYRSILQDAVERLWLKFDFASAFTCNTAELKNYLRRAAYRYLTRRLPPCKASSNGAARDAGDKWRPGMEFKKGESEVSLARICMYKLPAYVRSHPLEPATSLPSLDSDAFTPSTSTTTAVTPKATSAATTKTTADHDIYPVRANSCVSISAAIPAKSATNGSHSPTQSSPILPTALSSLAAQGHSNTAVDVAFQSGIRPISESRLLPSPKNRRWKGYVLLSSEPTPSPKAVNIVWDIPGPRRTRSGCRFGMS